jgi:hypothetical protein
LLLKKSVSLGALRELSGRSQGARRSCGYTEREKNLSSLAEMQEHMAEQAASQTKKPADESSDDKEEDDK